MRVFYNSVFGHRTGINILKRNETKSLSFYRGALETAGGSRGCLDAGSSCSNRSLGDFTNPAMVDMRLDRRIVYAVLAFGSSSSWVASSRPDRFYFLRRMWGGALGISFDVRTRGPLECFVPVRTNLLCTYGLNATLRSRSLCL